MRSCPFCQSPSFEAFVNSNLSIKPFVGEGLDPPLRAVAKLKLLDKLEFKYAI